MFQIVVVVGVAASYWLEYGLTVHIPNTELQWRLPLAFQLGTHSSRFVFLSFR